ncbi:hypothetical protein FRB99_006782 [Tulasnella sp. 403]|nr:hypothetical protein FRB99_006782 [Tulasnella sp. 403]
MAEKYIVKSCLSGDTLVLRARAIPGQPSKERILHIAEVSAPRLGTSQRDDEPFAFESREHLRALVGKEITFESTYSLPSNDAIPRDVGIPYLNGQPIINDLIKAGWVKVKDTKRELTDEDIQRRAIETEARNAGRGIWNPSSAPPRTVYHTMPNDSQGFITQWKSKSINGIVENVRDGSNLRVRLILSPAEHQFVNLSLAGVKCPRAAAREGEVSEPIGEEAKQFVDIRLLQRPVTVTLLSLPAPTATPFSSQPSDAPQAASSFIGTVIHAQGGNIAEHLVANGLARVIEWHAGMLSASGGMARLREAERVAKEKKLNLYGMSTTASTANAFSSAAPSNTARNDFEGPVVRIWSADQISVYDSAAGKDRRFQLSSVRGPKYEHLYIVLGRDDEPYSRSTDQSQAPYGIEAKEVLRKKLIGKTVHVHVDFVRPGEGDYEERECATIRFGQQKTNVSEQLIEKGLVTVVRHRRDDENRSPDYDKLIAAEQEAAAASRGLHSGKELPTPRIVNISETHSKASQFLPSLKRTGRHQGVVDFVAAGSRFKRYLQRDVEVQFENVDKAGGFIGSMYVNKTENVAVSLVREGLAYVHAYSAEGLSFSKQLFDAEEAAKAERKNIWKDYDEAAEAEATATESADGAMKTQYLDVIVSDVRPSPQFGFSVQILNNDGITALEKLMREFSLHHQSNKSSSSTYAPKTGELISARFSGDNGWYRAKVRRTVTNKKECEVVFIDYGNQETVPFTHIRPLDERFRSLPGQAQDARLSFVKLPEPSSDYYDEAVSRFRSLCEGRKLIANIDAKAGPLLHLRLIDPADSSSPTDSINTQLVREGYAVIDRKGCKYYSAYPTILKRLESDTQEAKTTRSGMFEFGDVSPEDD